MENNENNNNNSKVSSLKENASNYTELLQNKRENKTVPGFDFDVNTFENLIDSFTPLESIPVILGTPRASLDNFCSIVYGMNYKETYNTLSSISDMWLRRALKNLAVSGNGKAIDIVAKHFMNLDDQKAKDGINITIVNDLDKKKEGEKND